MISLHPMIVSRSVSRVAVPVIAKAIEKYIIVYRFDGLIREGNRQLKTSYKIKSGRVIKKIKEAESWEDRWQGDKTLDPDKLKKRGEVEKQYMKRKEFEASQKERTEKAKSATVSVGSFDFKTMSLEPTWMQVDVQTGAIKRTEVIGVKVLPALAKSDEQLSNLLLYDKGTNAIQKGVIQIGRWSVNKLYRIWDKLWDFATLGIKKSAKSSTVTGDIRKDILHNRTLYTVNPKNKSNIFICLSSHDITDDFFENAGGINKLFKMGWTSIVVADDVNRVAHFCTEEYRGQCVSLPYAVLYNTFSSMQVYESLEDAKKSAGSLFKTKFTVSKITSNILASKKLKKYRGR